MKNLTFGGFVDLAIKIYKNYKKLLNNKQSGSRKRKGTFGNTANKKRKKSHELKKNVESSSHSKRK